METFIKETITEAGKALVAFLGSAEIVRAKEGAWDIVTEADLASEKIILERIKAAYPDHGIVSEESAQHNRTSDYQWYIDPLDGTRNFEQGIYLFGINIALAYKGKLTHSAIFLPMSHELCYAEDGRGAFLNDKQISCSQKQSWTDAPYGIGSVKYTDKHMELVKVLRGYSNDTLWMNSIACAAAAGIWVADGRRDFYAGPGSNPWDYAAPVLLAKETGCVVTDYKGNEWKIGATGLVIANTYLHPKLIEAMNQTHF